VLLENLNKTLENVNMTLDSSARENLQGSLASLNKTLRNAAGVSAALNKVAPEFEQIVENLQVLSKGLGESAGDIQGSLENVNKITSQLSQAELDKAIVSLKNLSEKLQDPNGSVGKLLSTDSLHNSVNDLIKDIDELVERITENPKKYIRVSVF
jgi:phospholipid/cholesterol/gamma-HCH transport system substrate-binding protein